MTLHLTMALSEYAHTRDLVTGRVRAEGIDLTILSYPFEQVGLRFGKAMEWDISEFPFAGYCAHVADQGGARMVGLPVFPSRVFRQSAIFINEKSGIRDISDLRGRRIGIPQWSQTATIYVRGYLTHQIGIPLSDIEWIQAGVNRPGRQDPVAVQLPHAVSLKSLPESTLSDLLARGEIDAVISARMPDCVLRRGPGVRRLFSDARAVEEEYFRQTGIFPIMHVLVARRDTYEANRWIMRNLLDAFEEAKRAALPKLIDTTTSFLPTGWGPTHVEKANSLLFPDGNLWPYGTEPNRVTLEAFLLYCFEQGVTARHLKLEELFPPEFDFEIVV